MVKCGALSRDKRNEHHVLAAGLLDRAAADNAPGGGKQDHLEQHRRRGSGGAGLIVAEPLSEAGQVELVIEQVIQGMLEGAGQQLFGKNNGKKLRRPIDYLVAGHRNASSYQTRCRDLAVRT